MSLNGVSLNGVSLNGVSLNGTSLRFVLSGNGTTYASSPALITVLPYQTIYVDASRPISGDGTAWATACNTLAAGLAAIDSGHRILDVAQGTYAGPFQIPLAVAMYGGFPSGGGSFAARNPAANPTVLEGLASDGVTRVGNVVEFTFTSTEFTSATLDGFTVENGQTGVLVDQGVSPVLSNLEVQGNTNTGLVIGNGSQAVISDCRIENNTGVNGGGISAGAGNGVGTTLTLDKVPVTGGAITDAGGIQVDGGDTLTLNDVSVSGGIINDKGTIVITGGTTISNNTTIHGTGVFEIDASARNEALTHYGVTDTFVFNFANVGHDTVSHFDAAHDALQFSSSIFANATAVLAATHDVNGSAVISLDTQGDTITLTGVTKMQLAHWSDFHFV